MWRLINPVICRVKFTLLPKDTQNVLATAVFTELFRLLISQTWETIDSIAYNRTGKQQLRSNSMVINSEFAAKLFCINTIKHPINRINNSMYILVTFQPFHVRFVYFLWIRKIFNYSVEIVDLRQVVMDELNNRLWYRVKSTPTLTLPYRLLV